jgi:hypothetical protein
MAGFRWPPRKVPNMPTPGSRLGNLPDPKTFTDPREFILVLQDFVRAHFFSDRTTFALDQPGPLSIIHEDAMYFYGACLEGNDPACIGGMRKLARKNISPKLADNRASAWIDSVVAKEQFSELGPIVVEYVAAFVKLYIKQASPKLCAHTLTLTPLGEGKGNVIISGTQGVACSGLPCSVSIPDGASVTLTAQPDAESVFTSFSIAFAGVNPITIKSVKDLSIDVSFGIRVAGTVTSLSCIQPVRGVTEIVEAQGLLQGPVGAAVQIVTQGDNFNPNLFTFDSIQTTGFSCGGWTPNESNKTCSRSTSQAARSVWSQSTTIMWRPRFQNGPPAGGVSMILRQGNSIIASQHTDCPLQ